MRERVRANEKGMKANILPSAAFCSRFCSTDVTKCFFEIRARCGKIHRKWLKRARVRSHTERDASLFTHAVGMMKEEKKRSDGSCRYKKGNWLLLGRKNTNPRHQVDIPVPLGARSNLGELRFRTRGLLYFRCKRDEIRTM